MVNLVRLCYLFSLLLLPLEAVSQWNSFVVNYKKELFGRGAQTWQIKQYNKDHIYCGNKNGLLQYNGNNWILCPVNNRMDVRSVHPSDFSKKIYVGGESEFGYFEPGRNGEMIYHQTSLPFNEKFPHRGGYWGIYEIDNILLYVSDKFIVKHIEERFTVIESDTKIDCSGIVNGVVYLGTAQGIKMLVGNAILALPEGDILKNKTIRSIVPYHKGVMIATAFDGLYYLEEGKIVPYITGAEKFMKQNEVFSMAISGHTIAVGTIQKGLVLIGEDGETRYYNEQNGLQNNTILSLCFDNYNNLWLGLDNGIDYITLNAPFTTLYTYPYSKGAGYAALIDNDKLFLGTNRGLYKCNWPVSFTEDQCELDFISELSGQVWNLKKVGESIFCFHDKGLFIIQNNHIEQIPGLRGAILGMEHTWDPSLYWVGSYEGLSLLKEENGKWKVQQHIEDVEGWIWMKNFVFESPDVLWVRNINNGMFRVEIDTINYKVVDKRLYSQENGFGSLNGLYVHKIGDKICFSTLTGLYEYDAVNDKIVPCTDFNNSLLDDHAYTFIEQFNNNIYALSPNTIQVAGFTNNGYYTGTTFHPFNNVQIDFIKYYEDMTIVNDTLIIIPNEYGFALLNTAISTDNKFNKELFIEQVSITYPKDSTLYLDNYLRKNNFPEITYTHNALRFTYAVRNFGQASDVKYRYKLEPETSWSEYSSLTVKEYNNLSQGKYIFQVEALFPDGDSAYVQYPFVILPPWYYTIYARIAYLLMGIAFFYFLFKLDEKRVIRKRKVEMERREKEMLLKEQELLKENLKKEQQIIELKNEKLEQELKHKSQEMANLMINFSRKNEILMAIKEELSRINSELKGENNARPKRMLLTLNNKIDLNIESDDALKQFEEQFDLVHNNFIKKLSEKHPTLSVSERKMCAYIKMNLSSKEVAPLMNLSVRGVETLRYRLRKKIGLEREDSLTEYLDNFST